MILPSMRFPVALILGATLMAWRAYTIAPVYTAVQAEMAGWIFLGTLVLAAGFFCELVRWYQRMDRRYLPRH